MTIIWLLLASTVTLIVAVIFDDVVAATVTMAEEISSSCENDPERIFPPKMSGTDVMDTIPSLNIDVSEAIAVDMDTKNDTPVGSLKSLSGGGLGGEGNGLVST